MISALKRARTQLLAGSLAFFFLCLVAFPNHPAAGQATSPSIGLEIGQRAPAFEATDQSGRTQTNETLKGPNGTVLLFFRSADW
ncbi:MAG TPA: hypothetical protein VFO34_04485 [Candidatus Acidoferrales bacterium]|nr:hypothetical protein [Candidatus Acidoferrales bacterium]